MAKIVGERPPFIGTRDNITIYQMNGEYIARAKSCLTGKRVKHDPAFARTMENAGRLKKASCIASLVYRQMPENGRVYKQYRELVGKAMRLLKEGHDAEVALILLEAVYLPDNLPEEDSREDNLYVEDSHEHNFAREDSFGDNLPEEDSHEEDTAFIEYGVLVLAKLRKKGGVNNRSGIALSKSFGKAYSSIRRKSPGSRRFQAGVAGLRIFERQDMRLNRYSKPIRLKMPYSGSNRKRRRSRPYLETQPDASLQTLETAFKSLNARINSLKLSSVNPYAAYT